MSSLKAPTYTESDLRAIFGTSFDTEKFASLAINNVVTKQDLLDAINLGSSLLSDADVLNELTLKPPHSAPPVTTLPILPYRFVPLRIQSGNQPTSSSAILFQEAGGRDSIFRMTDAFYNSAFKDPVLASFIRDRTDPHATRFANWISENVGHDSSWSDERRTREIHNVTLKRNGKEFVGSSPSDRSTAHGNAWHSEKRTTAKQGQHFKLPDCRVWMRLHFWALKKAGIHVQSPSFAEFYCRFIGHYVRVYEHTAPMFAREAYRWSDNVANLAEYERNGRMVDVPDNYGIGAHIHSITSEEADDPLWPYYDNFEDMVGHRGNDDNFYPY